VSSKVRNWNRNRQSAGKVDEVRGAVKSGVTQVRDAPGNWDRLEQEFENRVSNAARQARCARRKELDELLKCVDELNREVKKLNDNAPKTLLAVMQSHGQRARDDLSDLAGTRRSPARAKQTAKHTIAKVKKTIRRPLAEPRKKFQTTSRYRQPKCVR